MLKLYKLIVYSIIILSSFESLEEITSFLNLSNNRSYYKTRLE